MRRFHEKLCSRYPWYYRWHCKPSHIFYHWLFFIMLSGFIAVVMFFDFNSVLRVAEQQANLNAGHRQFSTGKIMGFAGDHILVQFKEGTAENNIASILARHNLKIKSEIKRLGVKIVSLGAQGNAEEAVRRLNLEKDTVEFAEVDAKLEPSFVPNDPDFASEWHLLKINSPAAWDITKSGGITIAIADSGVDSSQPDLAAHLIPGWNFYDNNGDTNDVYGHGTAVAGTVGAIGDNALQVAGVAYNASIMPLRISDPNGYGYFSTIANAITYAADHGIKIVNVSYQTGGSQTIARAARYLNRAGGLVVLAEGNTGGPSGYSNDANIISVSATDNSDAFTSWSTYGNDVDVSAPGLAILTTARGGGTVLYSGTSFSAPIVSGVLALMWTANPALGPSDIAKALFSSAVDLGPTGWDEHYGWGRVDAARAVAAALTTTPTTNSAGVPGKKK